MKATSIKPMSQLPQRRKRGTMISAAEKVSPIPSAKVNGNASWLGT